MAAVAAHREEFEFDHHCGGPNLDATPNDIIERIERYSGVKLATVPPLSPGAAVSRQVAGACEVNPPVRCIQFRAAPDLPIRIQDRFLNTLCELLKQCRARGLARVGVTALQQL
jgi:hypothetical protein